MSSRTLEVRDLNKQFGKNLVLEDVELDAEPGEIVALVGPSAAGKSTLLRIVAGIEKPSSGTVAIDDRDVTETPSWKRNVAMAFESYVLYPNRTVFENIAFPLRKERSERRGESAAIERQVREIAEVLEIGPLLDRLPHALSGGQRQRVALGRALVRDADVYLLDEPISHLDAKLRHWLRGELRRRLREKGTPTVWATPDGAEAMAVGDRLALIVRGRIVQTGTAEAIYARPATARVAEIVGDPPMNLVPVEPRAGGIEIDGSETVLPLRDVPQIAAGAYVGVRARDLRIVEEPAATTMRATVVVTEPGTKRSLITVRIGRNTIRIVGGASETFRTGDEILVDWGGAHVFLFEGAERVLTAESVIARERVEEAIGGKP